MVVYESTVYVPTLNVWDDHTVICLDALEFGPYSLHTPHKRVPILPLDATSSLHIGERRTSFQSRYTTLLVLYYNPVYQSKFENTTLLNRTCTVKLDWREISAYPLHIKFINGQSIPCSQSLLLVDLLYDWFLLPAKWQYLDIFTFSFSLSEIKLQINFVMNTILYSIKFHRWLNI